MIDYYILQTYTKKFLKNRTRHIHDIIVYDNFYDFMFQLQVASHTLLFRHIKCPQCRDQTVSNHECHDYTSVSDSTHQYIIKLGISK